MSRSFRFMPPQPRSDLLTRPRLLRSLAERWQHRVTALTGGPGLGKTTLLAQAIAENRLAPRGEDVWIGLEAYDADPDRLSRVVADAITGVNGFGTAPPTSNGGTNSPVGEVPPAVDPAAVADAVWRLAPTEACLVIDDVHLLPQGSGGATWLSALVEALPANGHVVLASRSEPPVPLSRIGTQGAVLRLAEDDLRFSADELTGFAARRGLDPTRFDATGGWPAMAELAASVDGRVTGDYLWEEVLEPLGTMRRHVLAVLCDLGGADDELVSAAVGNPVDLARALDGVPLIARDAHGWHAPHGLWRSAPAVALDPRERADIRRRAATNLTDRGRFDEALRLLQEADLWDATPTVLRAACLSTDRIVASQLGRWLSTTSSAVRATAAGKLAVGLHTAYTAPDRAIEPLEHAADQCALVGDVEGELAASAELGLLSWFREDPALLARQLQRVMALAETGHPMATAYASLARSTVADMMGDDVASAAELANMDKSVIDPGLAMLAAAVEAMLCLNNGDADAAIEILDRAEPQAAGTAVHYIVKSVRMRAWWGQGHIDEVMGLIPIVLSGSRRRGVTYIHHLGCVQAGVAYAMVGEVAAARRVVDEALAHAPPPLAGSLSGHSAAVVAALRLATGDEAAATATLREAYENYGGDRGSYRHTWRQMVALSYVLLPETRAHWDAQPLRGFMALAREMGAAVVALREGEGASVLRSIDLPDVGTLRTNVPFNFLAELAVGLASVGRSEGRTLLDALGPPGREALRRLIEDRPDQAKSAKALLAAVPAPPRRSTYLGVLGPLVVRRDGPDGEEVVDPDLRRKRVQLLFAYLVGHRRTTRPAIAAALWPDLDDRSASNNLGVTLNHLLRLLEPWRDSGEPAFLLRLDGASVQLVTGEHLRVDVDEFDALLAAAGQAEADGTPSIALEHYLDAVAFYRDDLHVELPEAEWFVLDRELYRTRFVSAAVRAGQLLLARGDADRAQEVAQRALAVDPWSEGAYAVLVGAALARGDRSSAHRLLQRCLKALDDLGVSPTDTTLQLQRRIAS